MGIQQAGTQETLLNKVEDTVIHLRLPQCVFPGMQTCVHTHKRKTIYSMILKRNQNLNNQLKIVFSDRKGTK